MLANSNSLFELLNLAVLSFKHRVAEGLLRVVHLWSIHSELNKIAVVIPQFWSAVPLHL